MSAVFNIAYKKKKKAEPIVENTVFYFTSPEDFSVKMPATQTWDGTLEYSQDGDTWLTAGTNGTIAQNADGKIYFRGTGNTHLQDSTSKSSFFTFTGNDILCYGNCLVLLDYKKVEQNDEIEIAPYCFSHLFYSCSNLIMAPTLPATILAIGCYCYMFGGCTSLRSAPALPATTLAISCYENMFAQCTSLTSAPALPATTLVTSCYDSMFYGCTSLSMKVASDGVINKIPWRIPYNSNDSISEAGQDAVSNMFLDTQTDNITEPTLNTTYYTSAVVLPSGRVLGS